MKPVFLLVLMPVLMPVLMMAQLAAIRSASPLSDGGAALGFCTGVPDGTPCSDGNVCTTGDACTDGLCVGPTCVTCDDGNPCTDDDCDPEIGCLYTNNAAPCSDGDPCTTNDACSCGVCTSGPAQSCDDTNVCTDDFCIPGTGCYHTNNTAPCSDGNVCTTGDACTGGLCTGPTCITCDDGNPCTDDECDPEVGCLYTNNAAPCSDGNACTTADTCSCGLCTGGPPLNCDDGKSCTVDACYGGICSHSSFREGDPCGSSSNTACDNPDSCDDPGNCQSNHEPDQAPCADGSACTTNDMCAGGACTGTPVPPPAEVNDSLGVTHVAGATSIHWTDTPGPFSVYRGSRRPGAPWVYNQGCMGGPITGTSVVENRTPHPGTSFFYLVTRQGSCGESNQGSASSGTPRPNVHPCPDEGGDADHDGTLDQFDNCPGRFNPGQSDADGDGHGDACDNCPADRNPTQEDLDRDGSGDACDPDIDGDGILDDGDGSGVAGDNPCMGGSTVNCDDNCPRRANSDQANGDSDAFGDVCDPTP